MEHFSSTLIANSFIQTNELATIEAFVVLIMSATIVGIVAHKIKIPYTVSLLLVGLLLSALGINPHVKLTHDLLMMVFLPALLFEAAIHFPANELKQYAPTIATLAAPGVLLTAFGTAFVLNFGFTTFGLGQDFGFSHVLLFGTIIAATDPISVINLLRSFGVNKKISLLIEGESLFNDGTAIVLFTVVLESITAQHFSLSNSIKNFFFVAVGGIIIGTFLGLFASLIANFLEDHLISIALTTVTAYGSYLIAHKIEVSGVLATVAAGLFVGNMGKKNSMKPTTRIAVIAFWEYIAFFVSSIVFLMMGLEINPSLLIKHLDLIFLAFFAVLTSRAISVYLPLPILKKFGQIIPLKNATIMWWGGLRGALSMVLVLSLPDNLPIKKLLITITFGVVVLSIVVQGVLMGQLLRILNLISNRTTAMSFISKSLAKLRAIKSQQKELKKINIDKLPGIQILKTKLKIQKAKILKSLKNKRNNYNFINASKKKIQDIEEQLINITIDSYRESYKNNIIIEKETIDLISELHYKKNIY